MNNRRLAPLAALALLGLMAGGRPAVAQTTDLTRLSLEDLLTTEVTSVSRKEQTLSRTAAAVYVVTQEDIRRSGAKTTADLLRLVPGFSVAQVDATNWAVSARGFSGIMTNKLLVLIDGRSVYSPMFGGVHWELHNFMLSTIDRIEVIRGPGGTLWGTNAVNGVVNIITKPADETLGGYASVAGGTLQNVAEVRYGGRAGDAYYRVFGKHSTRTTTGAVGDIEDADGGTVDLGGARFDWRGETSTLVAQGSLEDTRLRHVQRGARDAIDYRDANVVVAWTRSASSRSETGIQAYYQRYERSAGMEERWHVIDVDGRYRVALGQRHEIVAGAGYRFSSVDVQNTPTLSISPAQERIHVLTGFIQDEIELGKGIRMTPGTKVEHNPFTGYEVQPSLRATWAFTDRGALWAAVSRAVRTPVKVDRGIRAVFGITPGFGGLPMVTVLEGNPELQSEDVESAEVGYRLQLGSVSMDVTAFRNGYDRLKGTQAVSLTSGSYEGQPVVFLPLRFQNLNRATAVGAELSMTYQPVQWWKVSGSYASLQVDTTAISTGTAVTSEGETPEHQFHVRSYVDLPWNIEASALFYATSAIEPIALSAYRKLDARLAWRASRAIELGVTAQNLFHGGDLEGADSPVLSSRPVRRGVSAEIGWSF